MVGLRESFDVVKRLAILQYLTVRQGKGCFFDEILRLYRLDHQLLQDSLKRYRSTCFDDSARYKMQTGLVGSTSTTSLNKYVRIAFEIGLLDFNYDRSAPKGGILNPNPISHVVTSLVGLRDKGEADLHAFELSSEIKFLIFHLLMERDFGFLIPLLYSLLNHQETLSVTSVRKDIVAQYAKNLATSLETILNLGRYPIQVVVAIRSRISIIKKYITKMNANQPARGMLHLLDSRLHWLYDLKLVDYEAFCGKGVVKPAAFWRLGEQDLVGFIRKFMKSKNDILQRYSSTLQVGGAPFTVESLPDWCVDKLSNYYSSLIPINSVTMLISARAAANGVYLPQQKIVSILQENGYSLYRGYDGTLGYVEIGKRSQQF